MASSRKVHVQRSSGWLAAALLGALFFLALSALLYARRLDYNLFIANKAVAGASVLLICSAFALGALARFRPGAWVPRLYLRKYFGVFGFGLAAVHALFSLVLLSPAYYPKLYAASGAYTGGAELALASGVLAFIVFAAVCVTSIPAVEERMLPWQWLLVQRTGYAALLLVLAHVAVLKWQGWLAASNWLNSLPPASLIPAAAIAFVLLFRLAAFAVPAPRQR